MKATLTFDLDIIDDRTRHIQCVKANDMAIALHVISEALYKRDDVGDDATFMRINVTLGSLDMEELCP